MRRLLLFFLFFSFCVTSVYGATVTRYVDTDVSGGLADGTSWANAYASLSAWNTAEATDLVTDGDIHIVNCAGSTDDTTKVYIDSGDWTTGASNYIEIIGDSTTGVFDDSKYCLNVGDEEYGTLQIKVSYLRLSNIQIIGTASGANVNNRVYISGQSVGSSDIRISNCLILGSGTTSSGHQAITCNSNVIELTVVNTVMANFPTTTTYGSAVYIGAVNTADFYNCTITSGGEYYGIRDVSGTTAMYNCAVFNNSNDDIRDIDTVENCATDQGAGEGTNGLDISTTWDSTCFTDESSGDYSIESDSPLVGEGQDDPGGTIQPDTDIAGTDRSTTWDIGAFEYEAAASTGSRLIIIQ